MVIARKLDILRSRNVLSKVASAFDRDSLVADAVENEGRYTDRRQEVAYVDLIIRAKQREDRSRTGCSVLEPSEPPEKHLIFAPVRRVERNQNALAPVFHQLPKE